MDKYNTKQCSKCSRMLPLDVNHFYRNSTAKDGYESSCKECRGRKFGVRRLNDVFKASAGNAYCSKCRKEKPLNREHFHKSKSAKSGWRGTCKKCRSAEETPDQKNSRHTRWRNENREHIRMYSKNYREQNRERENERARQWRLNNPEKEKIRATRGWHNRKARAKMLDSSFTAEQWEQCKRYFNDKCCYCEREYKSMNQDHFVPLSKGGEYTVQNIVPACRECNYKKHAKNFFEWYPEYKYYSKERERKILKYLGYKNNIQQLSIL